MTDLLSPSMPLPPLDTGPLLSSHITRWCAAQENWDRIHYDLDYARNIAGLPHTIINGALKQHLLTQCLAKAFGTQAWIWRLGFRFKGMDLVGESLRVEGEVGQVAPAGKLTRVSVTLRIVNQVQNAITTEGQATVFLSNSGEPVLDALSMADALQAQDETCSPQEELPEAVRGLIGNEITIVNSYSPVEHGRLRLFAEAIMDVAPLHYDPAAGLASPHRGVVALPLFPIHAMSQKPGSMELSRDPVALGREGVCEVGRNLAQILGLPPQGLLNGGCQVQVHSLVRPGEYVRAQSTLRAVRRRNGQRGGDMLVYDTANTYETTTGRPLLTEFQSMIQRMN